MNSPQSVTRQQIAMALAEKPDGVLETIAEECRTSLQAVLDCLPGDGVRRIDGSHFIAVLEDVTSWGDVTFVCHTADAIVEVSGPFPSGRMGHGMYNLQGGHQGLSGHFRPERCAAIYFVRRPFMGVETMSLQFVNREGAAIFKIFVGRDETRNLRQEQVLRFHQLAERMAAI